eukprot:jgi/Astpho2/9235/gw1.00138.36.1_t
MDLASQAAGASVVLATCCDSAHPPQHAIDGQKGTFWATTGMFPQELAISMSCTAAVNKVELEGVNSEPLACALC